MAFLSDIKPISASIRKLGFTKTISRKNEVEFRNPDPQKELYDVRIVIRNRTTMITLYFYCAFGIFRITEFCDVTMDYADFNEYGMLIKQLGELIQFHGRDIIECLRSPIYVPTSDMQIQLRDGYDVYLAKGIKECYCPDDDISKNIEALNNYVHMYDNKSIDEAYDALCIASACLSHMTLQNNKNCEPSWDSMLESFCVIFLDYKHRILYPLNDVCACWSKNIMDYYSLRRVWKRLEELAYRGPF